MARMLVVLLFAASAVACGERASSLTAPSAPSGARSTMSSSNHPPGQHPSGNPAHAPGCSNPNTVPSSDCKND